MKIDQRLQITHQIHEKLITYMIGMSKTYLSLDY